ncbi:MAG: hypothetical protein JF599_14150 [Verrucomicrobia bacterium]|nr:hypothetical protein [Verrucomicrobiota bacterium]
MGRREQHPLALSTDIERNATRTVAVANALMARAMGAGIHFDSNPKTGSPVSSGWRPPAVNAATKGAATNSKHMTGLAVDVYDPAGKIDAWLLSERGQQALVDLGVWIEDPGATAGWSHWQIVPPGSGRRVFHP